MLAFIQTVFSAEEDLHPSCEKQGVIYMLAFSFQVRFNTFRPKTTACSHNPPRNLRWFGGEGRRRCEALSARARKHLQGDRENKPQNKGQETQEQKRACFLEAVLFWEAASITGPGPWVWADLQTQQWRSWGRLLLPWPRVEVTRVIWGRVSPAKASASTLQR